MMTVKDCCTGEADCCSIVVYYTEKCLMVNYKRTNSNLYGHLGIERITSLLRDQFYWPSMIEDIKHYIKSCPRYLRFKTQPEKVELNPIIATRPIELVHIDNLTIEVPANSKSDKDINVLIITDHFTQCAQAHA